MTSRCCVASSDTCHKGDSLGARRHGGRVDIDLFVLSSLTDLRADALRLHLTLQDDLHYAERRQALLRRKVEQCTSTFRTLLDRDPLTTFRHQLQQDLDELGRFESCRGACPTPRPT